jgi:uncharacterized protein (DUF1786 family)
MNRFLLVDIGAGTMDILYYDRSEQLTYKAVVESPVRTVARRAAALPGPLLVTGCEMGGGPITEVLRRRADEAAVVMTAAAAATLHHDLQRVRGWGIRIVAPAEADELRHDPQFTHLEIGDLELDRIEQVVSGFGVPFEFDAVGVCAQDHGVPPSGMSHLDYRHQLQRDVLDSIPQPHAALYADHAVPPTLNRLKSIAAAAKALPAANVYVMDSGMAAILGASLDAEAAARQTVLVLDIATSHTVGAALDRGDIAGFFEYHTRDITAARLQQLLVELADGKLAHEQILAEGGHGAYLRRAVGFDAVEAIIATGPKRRLLAQATLPVRFGAPWGDNMMTGTVGLLEAIRRHADLEPITYL